MPIVAAVRCGIPVEQPVSPDTYASMAVPRLRAISVSNGVGFLSSLRREIAVFNQPAFDDVAASVSLRTHHRVAPWTNWIVSIVGRPPRD